MEKLLSVENLEIKITQKKHVITPVKDVSFNLLRGETIGIVGESGCGKTLTALSIMRLAKEEHLTYGGAIRFEGRNLLELKEKQLRGIRGSKISMIFQEPMTSLNPLFSIGNQLIETIRAHDKVSKGEAKSRAVELLKKVRIERAEQVMKSYPYQLSGGMQQRVMISMALACSPDLLIADEPTTALDVTIQFQILSLIKELQAKLGMALLLISHDLGVVSQMVERVVILYAGYVVETGNVDDIFLRPQHPYTRGLLKSVPNFAEKRERLYAIPGMVPLPDEPVRGCPYYERCDCATDICGKELPLMEEVSGTQAVRCWSAQKKV